MSNGAKLTLCAIRFSLACYVAALAIRMYSMHASWQRLARILWSVGCLAYLLHVVCAFHFYHAWSHTAAYEATARDTARLFQWNCGGGLFFNCAFTLIWLADVLWWWRGLEAYAHR